MNAKFTVIALALAGMAGLGAFASYRIGVAEGSRHATPALLDGFSMSWPGVATS